MTSTLSTEIRIVIGSWGSYNACNNRAYGSTWLTLSHYNDWDEIEEELNKQGFQLDEIDEELFVQDIENIDLKDVNTDYLSPQHLFEILNESGVLLDNDKLKIMEAFIEVRSFREFEELVTKHGENWNDDIYIYHNYDWEDYGREMFNNCGYELPGDLENYFDFEEYGKSFSYSDNIEEFSGGLIEIN